MPLSPGPKADELVFVTRFAIDKWLHKTIQRAEFIPDVEHCLRIDDCGAQTLTRGCLQSVAAAEFAHAGFSLNQ